MSTTNAILALGLYAPNLAFSVSGDAAGRAAGWTPDAGTGFTETAMFGDGPSKSHARWQRYALSTATDREVVSAACTTGKLCGTGSHQLRYAILCSTSGNTGRSQIISLKLRRYKIDGTVLETLTIRDIVTANAAWTLITGDASVTFSALCHHSKYVLTFGRTGGGLPVSMDIAGVGIGIWTQSVGSVDIGIGVSPSTRPAFSTRPIGDVHTNSVGANRRTDHGRYFQARVGVLAWEWIPDATMNALHQAWAVNIGSGLVSSSVSPEGGYWPLLVLPGLPSWPQMMMADISGNEPGFGYAGDWVMDPGFFSGGLPLVEVF